MAAMIATYRGKPFAECTSDELFKASEYIMRKIDIIVKQLKQPSTFGMLLMKRQEELEELNKLGFIAKQLTAEMKKRKDALANAT